MQATLQGLGVAYLPEFIVRGYLASRQLESVLSSYLKEGGKFSVVWPSSRHMLPKVRVFIDFLTEKQVLG